MGLAQGHRASGLEILEQRGERGDFLQWEMEQGLWVGAVGEQESRELGSRQHISGPGLDFGVLGFRHPLPGLQLVSGGCLPAA